MITIENVLEEVVGAIEDEFDHDIGFITLLNENEAEAKGTCPIDRLNRVFNLLPRDTEADTIGGYITELAERIPTTGDSLADADLKFTVLEASTTSVVRVKITRSTEEKILI